MLPMLATGLASMFGGAGGGGQAAPMPADTVTIDTGDITPTLGGGEMNLGAFAGSGSPMILIVGLAVVALLVLRR